MEADLQVEVVNVDYYMHAPLPQGAIEKLPISPCYQHAANVPVVRVFGSTPAGQRCLVHLHGIFPYFYFRAENDQAFEDPVALRDLLPRLAKEIEQANVHKQTQNRSKRSTGDKLIAKLVVVRGIPFYGFHRDAKLFVQIFLYNPRTVSSVVEMLESGVITKRKFQAYEAHIPYLLQVFADYHLEGMSYATLSHVKFRAPLPREHPHMEGYDPTILADPMHRMWLSSNTPQEKISGFDTTGTRTADSFSGRSFVHDNSDAADGSLPEWFERHSSCALEVDVAGAAILNPQVFQTLQQSLEHLGEARVVPSLAAIWEEERHRRERRGERCTPDFSLSVKRIDVQSTLKSPSELKSPALSQSFFTEKMRKAVDEIVERLAATTEQETRVSPRPSESAVKSVDSQQGIDVEGEFSFTQVHDPAITPETPHETAKSDDENIMSLLLCMKNSEQDHRRAEDIEQEMEEEDIADDENAAILLSQRQNEEFIDQRAFKSRMSEDSKTSDWWSVAEQEEHSSVSLSDVGSSRFCLHTRKRQRRRPSEVCTNPSDEESKAFPEDIIPPQPPVRASASSERDYSLLPEHNHINKTSRKVGRSWVFEPAPPGVSKVNQSSRALGIEPVQHCNAHYSNADDIPDKAMVFAGTRFEFRAQNIENLPLFLPPSAVYNQKLHLSTTLGEMKETMPREIRTSEKVKRIRTPASLPPSEKSLRLWLEREKEQGKEVPSTCNPSVSAQSGSASEESHHVSNLCIFSIEILASCRGNLLPDPLHDPVRAICYAIESREGGASTLTEQGVICVSPDGVLSTGLSNSSGGKVAIAKDECHLFELLVLQVRKWDPDFLVGYEVQKASIGYLVDRGAQLDLNLIQSLSRLPKIRIDARNPQLYGERDEGKTEISIGTSWGITKASGLWIHGRYILNLWRMTRSELKLSRYSLEDVVRHVFHIETPVYSSTILWQWFEIGGPLRCKCLGYFLTRARYNLKILSKLQLITRTSEMARLFGIDFYSVLSRGSQYRVEAVMLRVTKRKNFILVSPSRAQVAGQPPMECIPLVMEPHSGYYPDPVVVLDFQSLYPSLVIGYNMCYSTLIGRLKGGIDPELESHLGVIDFLPSSEALLDCRGDVTIAPNGTLFSPTSQRQGVLPVILDEILSTRIMVKNAMKHAKDRGLEQLEKVLNARQLALKMISNVTYGYTAAGFSGRMPCAQLADAIVQSGRNTLEAAVKMVESNKEWNARIVYGDTDSIFVLLRGRSKEEAFVVGQEIAVAVTAANPRPVTLKLEKVYLGCILVSKKRYVGFKYEHPSQDRGIMDSKGIETVRRDSCRVVQKAMDKCLRILFTTADVSLVRRFLEKHLLNMLNDKCPLWDFVFAKEVRLGTYSEGSAPPAALVSCKAMSQDPRKEPRYAERVPYVVVNGAPGARLVDLVVAPDEIACSSSRMTINHRYYIDKQILPSLERLFLLFGVNIRQWYAALPKRSAQASISNPNTATKLRSIDSFYMSKHCCLCGALGTDIFCSSCHSHSQRRHFHLMSSESRRRSLLSHLQRICFTCGDRYAYPECTNLSCPIRNTIDKVMRQKLELIDITYDEAS